MNKQDLIDAAVARVVADRVGKLSIQELREALDAAPQPSLNRLRQAILANRETEVGRILIREIVGPYNKSQAEPFVESLFSGDTIAIADLLRTYP